MQAIAPACLRTHVKVLQQLFCSHKIFTIVSQVYLSKILFENFNEI